MLSRLGSSHYSSSLHRLRSFEQRFHVVIVICWSYLIWCSATSLYEYERNKVLTDFEMTRCLLIYVCPVKLRWSHRCLGILRTTLCMLWIRYPLSGTRICHITRSSLLLEVDDMAHFCVLTNQPVTTGPLWFARWPYWFAMPSSHLLSIANVCFWQRTHFFVEWHFAFRFLNY